MCLLLTTKTGIALIAWPHVALMWFRTFLLQSCRGTNPVLGVLDLPCDFTDLYFHAHLPLSFNDTFSRTHSDTKIVVLPRFSANISTQDCCPLVLSKPRNDGKHGVPTPHPASAAASVVLLLAVRRLLGYVLRLQCCCTGCCDSRPYTYVGGQESR